MGPRRPAWNWAPARLGFSSALELTPNQLFLFPTPPPRLCPRWCPPTFSLLPSSSQSFPHPLHFTTAPFTLFWSLGPCAHQLLNKAKLLSVLASIPHLHGVFIILMCSCISAPSHTDADSTPVLWPVGHLFLPAYIWGFVVFPHFLVVL